MFQFMKFAKYPKILNEKYNRMILHQVLDVKPKYGENTTSIEPNSGAINDICVFNESGLMLLALVSSQIPAYFVLALDPASKWYFILVPRKPDEEMELGSQTTNYDDFKFLTTEEFECLKLTNLIGTNLFRAYMHGFFIDHRPYKKVMMHLTFSFKRKE
ncbi:unnamed protein product, partial [Musa acuminata subsp. burmannicoides]